MRNRLEFGLALLLDLLGAGLALLVSTREWQQVVVPRPRPLSDVTMTLSGRTVDNAPTALAVVALAGVVALLATRGWPRRAIGALLAAAGIALIWRSALGFSAISPDRALNLELRRITGIDVPSRPNVVVHEIWPALSLLAGVLIVAAGVLTAWRSHRWGAMSARYEPPVTAIDAQQERQRADASLWTALDRGDDPTAPGETP